MSTIGHSHSRYRNRQFERTAVTDAKVAATAPLILLPVMVPSIQLRTLDVQWQADGPLNTDTFTGAEITVTLIRANIEAHNKAGSTAIPLTAPTPEVLATYTLDDDRVQYEVDSISLNANEGLHLELLAFPLAYLGDQVLVELATPGTGTPAQSIIAQLKYKEDFKSEGIDEADGPELAPQF